MKTVGYENAYFGISDAEEEGIWRFGAWNSK